jgi:hypothetical protein
VFRTVIRADERTDIAKAVTGLRRSAERRGVSGADAAQIAAILESTLNDLVARGRSMAASGSTVAAEKTLKSANCEVRLVFGAGERRSILRRIPKIAKGDPWFLSRISKRWRKFESDTNGHSS